VGLPLAAFAASRAVTLAAVAAGLTAQDGLGFTEALLRYDGQWYLQVAATGYPGLDPATATGAIPDLASNGAFFPLYPLAIHGVTLLGVPAEQAALVVAGVFGAATAVALRWLVARLAGAAVADRAVIAFCFFPGAFVLSMAYAEPMMLFWAIACLGALLTRRWGAAGVAGALATAARPNAVVLALCCAWAAVVAVRRRGEWRALVAPALAPLGFVGHLGLLWYRTGEPLAWLTIQRNGWGEGFDFGLTSLQRLASVVGLAPDASVYSVVVSAGLVFAVVAGGLMWRWRPPAELVIYAVGIVVLAAGSQLLGVRPRFALTAFPLIVAVAYWVRGTGFAVLTGVSAALLAAVSVIHMVAFVANP
jgi:hypothetical protein